MDKKELAHTLEEIGVLLELKGENPFKTRAYMNAARIIEQQTEDIKDLVVNIREQEAFANKNWTQITPVSMTPAQEETDDKLFSMTLEFNIRRDLRI